MTTDEIVETIRAALAPDAAADARKRGAETCRAILHVLEPKTAAPAPAPTSAPEIAALVGAVRGMPPEQLLDLAIARLRAALPAGVEVPNVAPIRFNLIPVPPKGV